jgi:chromosomal replication initiation ATPase DnaA
MDNELNLIKRLEKTRNLLADEMANLDMMLLQLKQGVTQVRNEYHLTPLEEEILDVILSNLGVELEEMQNLSRIAKNVENRMICMYILREVLGLTFEKIGSIFNRDHATVIHAHSKIADYIKIYPKYRKSIQAITEEVNDLLKMSERQFQDYKGIESETIPC